MRCFWTRLTLIAFIVLFSYRFTFTQEAFEVIESQNAAGLSELARYGNGMLTGYGAWSPDGETLAVGGTLGIWFYDMADVDKPPNLLDLDAAVYDLEYSPDGRYLTYSTAGYGVVLDVESGENIFVFENAQRISFHPNGQHVAVAMLYDQPDEGQAAETAVTNVWNLNTQELITRFEPSDESKAYSFINDLSFSPDGESLAISYSGPSYTTCGTDRSTQVEVWKLASLEDMPLIVPSIELALFTNDSSTLVSKPFFEGFGDNTQLQFTNLITYQDVILETMPDNDWGNVVWYGLHPQNGQIVTLTTDQYLRFWDATTQRKVSEHLMHEETSSVVFSPDGSQMASVTPYEVILWTDNLLNQTVLPFEMLYETVKFAEHGEAFVTTTEQRQHEVWHINGSEISRKFTFTPDEEGEYIFSHDGSHLAFAQDEKLLVWSAEQNEVTTLFELEQDVQLNYGASSFSPDNRYLLLAYSQAGTNRLRLVAYQSPAAIQELEFNSESIFDAEFSSDGTQFYVRRDDTYEVYEVSSLEMIFQHKLQNAGYGWFSPDFEYFTYLEHEYNMPTYLFTLSTVTKEMISDEVKLSYGGVLTDFSPDGRYVLVNTSSVTGCGGDVRTLYVHRMPSMQVIASTGLPSASPGTWGGVSGIFSSDGNLYFSYRSIHASQSGEQLVILPFADIQEAAFTSGGKFLVLNQAGTIRIWGIPTD